MANYNSAAEIIEELQKRKQDYLNALALLNSISRATKKDGTNFQNISKNFISALNNITINYYIPAYSLGNFPELCISGYINGKYCKEEIRCYMYEDDVKADKDTMPGIFVNNGSCVRNSYILTISEIFELITNTIEKYTNIVREYDEQIARTEKAFNNYLSSMEAINKQLTIDCGCKDSLYHNSLYYLLKDVYIRGVMIMNVCSNCIYTSLENLSFRGPGAKSPVYVYDNDELLWLILPVCVR